MVNPHHLNSAQAAQKFHELQIAHDFEEDNRPDEETTEEVLAEQDNIVEALAERLLEDDDWDDIDINWNWGGVCRSIKLRSLRR